MFWYSSLSRTDRKVLIIIGIVVALMCAVMTIHEVYHPRVFSQQELRRLHKAAEWQQTHPEELRQAWRDIDRYSGRK